MEYGKLPDMKALATLKAVVELGGVVEAGQRLHIGQPAVTKRLRALDQCYGVEVMRREGRRLELTAAGERIYQFARLMLDHQDSLLDDLEFLRSGRNRLRLEVTFDIGEHLLPDLLLTFGDSYPGYQLQSRMGYTRRIQTRLAAGLADLALLEQAPDHPDILVQHWFDDELLLVCGPGHALWGQAMIALHDLQSLHYVLREPQSSMRANLDKALEEAGIPSLQAAMEVGSTDTIVEMLQRGRHVSFVPRFAVKDALDQHSLFHVSVQGLRIRRTLWIARTRSNLNNEAAEAFIRLLRDSAGNGRLSRQGAGSRTDPI